MNQPSGEAGKADPKAAHVAAEWEHPSPLIACRFDPTGRFVFATAEDHTVLRWELNSGKKTSLAAHDSWVRGLGFADNGQTLLTGGYDGRIVWWPAADPQPKPLRTVYAHEGWMRCLSVSPDGRLLATGGNDRLVKLFNTQEGRLVRELAGHEGHIYSTLFHPDGHVLLSGDLKGQVHQWDIETGKRTGTFDAKTLHSYNGGQQVDYGGVRSMALSPDGKHLACSGLHKATNPLGAVNDPIVLLFELESHKQLRSLTAGDLKGIAWRTLFHPDGYLIACSGGSGGGFLLFWNVDEEKHFFQLALPNTARDTDLHPDGMSLAVAHHDQHLRLVRLAPKEA